MPLWCPCRLITCSTIQPSSLHLPWYSNELSSSAANGLIVTVHKNVVRFRRVRLRMPWSAAC